MCKRKTLNIKNFIKSFNADEEQIMLVDYCVKKVATIGGNGYRETVLYMNKDGSCEIHFYSKYDGCEEESHASCPADKSVIKDIYKIIEDNKIVKWNKSNNSNGMTGAEHILKFRTTDGEYIRVTSARMPLNGFTVMESIKACMNSHTVS